MISYTQMCLTVSQVQARLFSTLTFPNFRGSAPFYFDIGAISKIEKECLELDLLSQLLRRKKVYLA